MSDANALQGLSCPKCGGTIAIPEGQVIVRCPYCDLRSIVRGDRGLRHYQVPCRVDRNQAVTAYQKFLGGNMAIARDAARSSTLSEAFVVYLPFWAAWARIMGWAFGEVQEGSGDHRHYEPREMRLVEEMSWDGAACDVGEFGVTSVPLNEQQMEPFQPDALHRSGMVFEPVGSISDATASAESTYQKRIESKLRLDRTSQVFTRNVRRRMGMVYYPLWIVRYLYRGRAFQVAVDGSSGKVLYGKAPGNTLYRAAVLVGGMAIGALAAIDIPAAILSGRGDNTAVGALIIFLIGLGIMYAAYRTFRYGEVYEYRNAPRDLSNITDQMGGIGKLINLVGR
jgi:DNA-directed RNA polymerase subunit RPC12/RpoP